MDAARALADLTEISSQIQSAVIVDADDRVLASTFSDETQARRVAEAARALVEAAGASVEAESRVLAQVEAATSEGSVFVVRDGGLMIAATTTPDPTVGLVFYDLKSWLRTIVAGDGVEAKPKPKPRRLSRSGASGDDGTA